MPGARHRPRVRTASLAVSDSLVDAALSLLEESGMAGLTVRDVATRAGVAPMGVYSRFGGKDGLLEALFVHGFGALQQAIDIPADAPAIQRLRDGCQGYRQFAIGNPQLYHLMFEQMMVLELSADATQTARRSFAILVERVSAAMDAGDLATENPTEVAQHVWSTMHGAVSLEIAGVDFAEDRQGSFTRLMDALLAGLATPPL
jgi:AcrR family transcriptional regulator